MYKFFIRPLLFISPPEFSHYLVMWILKVLFKIPFLKRIIQSYYRVSKPELSIDLFGIKFKNRLGLAAGFDKNAKFLYELESFGFGHIEIGTVTPEPQKGNKKPRLFRITGDNALINRMGFNNYGAIKISKILENRPKNIIIGGNIGKNKITPISESVYDYLSCFDSLYEFVDYFVVNVSSPNTPGLRDLQQKEPLGNILRQIQKKNTSKPFKKPILLKIAPDLSNQQIDDVLDIVKDTRLDGIIATNTTLSRKKLTLTEKRIKNIGLGGLSGQPLEKRSTEVIRYISQKTNKKLPIIGVGGIHSSKDALDKIRAGASLVQIYTGFIYEGPGLIKKINEAILEDEIN